MYLKKVLEACSALNIKPTRYLIFVSVGEQKLYLFCENALKEVFTISTSKVGISNKANSNGTPLGLHKIDGKIGQDAPLMTVFRGRKPCGLVADQPEEERQKNLITTRILRLRGLEDGVNLGGDVDTYSRYVYIHGTNREDLIGTPDSHGCVLMRNADIVRFFELVCDGSIVLISR